MSDAFNLLDETFTTIAVRFYNDDEEDFKPRGKTYNYKVPRSWDVQVGDLLVVPDTPQRSKNRCDKWSQRREAPLEAGPLRASCSTNRRNAKPHRSEHLRGLAVKALA